MSQPSTYLSQCDTYSGDWAASGAKYSTVTSHFLFCFVLAAVASFASLISHAIFVILIVIATAYLTYLADKKNLFQMGFLCGHYAFCIYPLLLYSFLGVQIAPAVASLCLFGTIFALMLTRRGPRYIGIAERLGVNLRTHLIAVALFLAILIATEGASFLYTTPYIVISFHLLTLSERNRLFLLFAYFAGLAYILLYFAVYSSGFGRLALASPIFMLTLIIANSLRVPFTKFAILASVPVGGFFGSLVRSDAGLNMSQIIVVAAKDSIANPLLLFDNIYALSRSYLRLSVSEWFDQFMLFFLAFFPRAIWAGKPEGFGFEYTVENYESYMIVAGHSVAATFVGEHFYYLGPVFGVGGMIIAILLISYLWRIMCVYKDGYLAVGIAVNLPTFYWGGMQAYSSRNLLWFVPALVLSGVISSKAVRGRSQSDF